MTKVHKATNQKQFLLRRKLTVEGLSEVRWGDLIQELNHHPCVDFAEGKPEGKLIAVFDGRHWSTDELVALIEANGGRLKTGWWQRQRLAWYRFADDNVRANAKHEPFCCSKIPPMKK
ncbi:hypothetical protein HLV39_11755 [Marinobacter adhaerens]|uniref:Uncharacterized protein n=1 Tax=Marinobacter adhaerens TaxID=1033846 RepID=A0A851HT32_9GAMM|nr:hypothetical protein [Marinobacter adhaerens]NWN92167.1 hypothetical protein [Marinobacter adhaerens]